MSLPHPADIGRRMRSPMQRICGWCRADLTPGTQPATYVICAPCQLQLEREVMGYSKRRAREPFATPSRRKPRHSHMGRPMADEEREVLENGDS
jgi:hypothetical protein